MSGPTTLQAADGFTLGAYTAGLDDAPRALVVLQEIFGVNGHMRNVCEGFATAGFRVVCPNLFDRAERDIVLPYDNEGIAAGLALRGRIDDAATLHDIEAAAASLGRETVGIIGYCWGGTLAWAGATRTDRFRAAVGWYGGGIVATKDAAPRCPVQLHFGADDQTISADDVAAIRAAQPEVEIFVYDGAGHGFGCDERASHDPKSTAIAQERTLTFLTRHL